MPKVRDWSLSYPYWDGCGRYPYPPIDFDPPRPRLASVDEMKEWDDTKCPICMEIPHNTVVLKCSSYDKGCRPYMCNTSSRHSNCLDQFCKSFDSSLSSSKLEEIPFVATTASNSSQCGNRLQPKLTCPLCRGGIYGYMVSETARRYMNSKLRSCSSETCEFQGTYPELRKHARVEHPTVRPTEVDPSRQGDWERMEQQRELEDVISSMNERYSAENSGEDTILSGSMHDLMSLVAYQLLTVEEGASLISSLWSDPTPRPRMSLHDRRYETVHRVSNVTQTNQSARWRSGLPSTHHHRRIHRAGSRINPSSSHDPEGAILMSSLWSDPTPRPRMSLHDRRYETVHRVSNVTQTNQSARWRSGLPSTHHHRRIGSRINPSSSHDPEGARLMSSLWSDPTPRPRNE
ncbi:unnamed protein product [Trifolium pratense]|uniref:Uncharacterized protein n=1 Tax=Trifolium pratense TaxID=57577 RepID=A0ACB0MA01_TRIPR|nr:unnamed protein product [Trifolium pratense]